MESSNLESIMTNDNSIMKFEEVMAYLDIGKSTLYTYSETVIYSLLKSVKPGKSQEKLLRIMFRNLSAVNKISQSGLSWLRFFLYGAKITFYGVKSNMNIPFRSV